MMARRFAAARLTNLRSGISGKLHMVLTVPLYLKIQEAPCDESLRYT
jgi:hypothetical protein